MNNQMEEDNNQPQMSCLPRIPGSNAAIYAEIKPDNTVREIALRIIRQSLKQVQIKE